MTKSEIRRQIIKNQAAWKISAIACFAAAVLFFWAWHSSGAIRDFGQADDFPRDALVYAQFRDLPALLKIWDESELKKRYLESENFRQFQDRHLGLKLASRWREFNDALGFEISSDALFAAAENRAAIAVYDIGKMEIVFISPVGGEKFAATFFFQNLENFEPATLADGSVYYSRNVEADRGRQRQKILFAHSKDRFVLATSENLLLRALANINGKTRKDRLADEPAFANLAKRVAPREATVWVDQARLNEDWYFKRYWAMRNIAELKTIRAGMFDFEIGADKLIERREFLLGESKEFSARKISAAETARLKSFVPAEAPFFRLRQLAGKSQQTAVLLRDTIIDRKPAAAKSGENKRRWTSYDDFDETENHGHEEGFFYLDSSFDEFIDENEETITVSDGSQTDEEARRVENDLQRILSPAQISSVVTIFNPRERDAPLFVQFEKAAVFYLNSPEKFDRRSFENIVSEIAQNDLAVAGNRLDFNWSDQADTKTKWRELRFPALERQICYAVRGNALLITNSAELLKSLLIFDETNAPLEKASESFDELSVIRLEHRAAAFDAPMRRLFNEENKHQSQSKTADNSADFFTGNIGSLLTAVNRAKQIEIKRSATSRFLTEEIVIVLKANHE